MPPSVGTIPTPRNQSHWPYFLSKERLARCNERVLGSDPLMTWPSLDQRDLHRFEHVGDEVGQCAQNPKIKVYGVEPEGANAMQESLAAGKPIQLHKVNTIADGLAPPMAGKVPFGIIKKYMDDVVTVSDEEIGSAVIDLLTRTKLLVEPAGAAATAAILSKKIPLSKGQRVVSILSGGNMDLDRLSEIILENDLNTRR